MFNTNYFKQLYFNKLHNDKNISGHMSKSTRKRVKQAALPAMETANSPIRYPVSINKNPILLQILIHSNTSCALQIKALRSLSGKEGLSFFSK